MSDLGTSETEQFEFRGKAGEWFGIWIVNLLLSIITIGIYSAWAKVRRKKYFYNHTFVAGRNFDYHATGKQILIGRIIFIAAYFAFVLLVSLVPVLGIFLLLGLLVLIPWLIVKSMQFNARVSSFSNVRFNFEGKTGRAFVVFILMPIAAYLIIGALLGGAAMIASQGSLALGAILGVVGLVVLFLAFPVVDKAVKEFVVNNYRLGHAEFKLDCGLAPFVKALGAALGWVVLVGIITAVLFGSSFEWLAASFQAMENGGDPDPAALAAIGTIYLLFFVAFLPAAFIYQAMIRNTVFNNGSLTGNHQFRSTVGPIRLLWIAISNAFVVALTLGLMLPWAQVRLHKYMATQTFLIPGESLDNFVGRQIDEGMSVADAYTDIEGIDFGIPL